MKRIFTILAVTGLMTFGAVTPAFSDSTDVNGDSAGVAMDRDTTAPATDDIKITEEDAAATSEEGEQAAEEKVGQDQVLKRYFIEGGPFFMSFVLIALIIGLALCIERIVYLNMASTNTSKLLNQVEEALNTGGVEAAKEVCRNTKGPVASIFYQGLDRADEGIDVAEKAVMQYGSVQTGLLEKGLSWISLFIALAPMLGFMGTVIGMIQAFDTIEQAETIEVSEVAKGIKVALLTTVFGLIVAIILQIFYNYIVSLIDSMVNKMEDASIGLIDLMVKSEVAKRNQ